MRLKQQHAEIELPALAQSVGGVRDEVIALARAEGFDDGAISAVAVAVSEAANNVVVHAYRDADCPGMLYVVADVQDGELTVAVSDDGPGVREHADGPFGLGLSLIAALAADFEVARDDRGRHCVRMRFGGSAAATSLRTTGRFRRPPADTLPGSRHPAT